MKAKMLLTPKPRLFSALDRRKTVTLGDLTRATDIPLTTLRDWIKRGLIPGVYRIGGGKGSKWRINREAAEQWWQELQNTNAVN